MSGIILQGYGKHNLIITGGYCLWPEVKEIITEVISRVIPVYREKFKIAFPLRGDLERPFESELEIWGDLIEKFNKLVPIKGKKDLSEIFAILLEKEPEEDLDDLDRRIAALTREEELLRMMEKEAREVSQSDLKLLTEAEKIQRAQVLMAELSETDKARDSKRRQKTVEELYKLLGAA